jgi:hypothetical protein
MQYVCVDIEADGPIPGDFSMIELGAVVVTKEYNQWRILEKPSFFGQFAPISKQYDPAALTAIGRTRAETLGYPDAWDTIELFWQWCQELKKDGPIRFVSDNAGFDWMFVCWYFHHYMNEKAIQQRNPFGFSCDSLTSMYKGYRQKTQASFQRDGWRGNHEHTHNAGEDTLGNAYALCRLLNVWDANRAASPNPVRSTQEQTGAR